MANYSQRLLKANFYGFEQDYLNILKHMHELHEQIARDDHDDHLMLLEHKAVITLTRQHQERSLLTSRQEILDAGIDLCQADRGGDATFHGPGQLVGYPLINLKKSGASIESYLRNLELALLRSLQQLGLKNIFLIPNFTGLWIKNNKNNKINLNKICAIGVGVKDSVTKHGFALNISINSALYTKHIIPCGLRDRGVITLQDAFYLEHLEMPDYLVILKSVSKTIAETFSLQLSSEELKYG
jgi:lipoate-protein ligase B